MNDNHQHIDDLVRKRLQALPNATPPPGGWAALQRGLDGDADLVLRNALTGLAAGTAPTGWEALERKMNPKTIADQQLADRLNGLKPAPPTGWETLAARLDHENDSAVDAIVTKGLAKNAPATTSGWAALAARLELIGWRRGTVAAWKITECCLLLSLLLLLVRFGPTAPSTPTFAELAGDFPLPLQEAKAPKRTAGKNAKVATNEPETPGIEAGKMNKALFAPAPEKTVKPARTNRSAATPKSIAPLPRPQAATPLSRPNAFAVEMAESGLHRTPTYRPNKVPALTINKLKTSLYPPSPALTLPGKDTKEPIYLFIDGFVSPVDLNQVITPNKNVSEFNIDGGRRVSYGKSFGLMLDVFQGKNGFQIGYVYSRRSYIPTELRWLLEDDSVVTEPFFTGGYTRFVYDAVEMQFNYKRTLLQTEKWRLSGKVGMGLNLIAFADFANQDLFIREFNDFLELRPPPTGGARSERNIADERELKDPAAGFLEGSGLFDNSSLYFNGGIVVERLVNQRWSVYVAPSFGRALLLEGIGPYNDRINSTGLRFGSRYHFGGK